MKVTGRGKRGLNCTAAVLKGKGTAAKILTRCETSDRGLPFKKESSSTDAHSKMEMQGRESGGGHITPPSRPAVALFRNAKPLMQSKSKLMGKLVGI